MQGPRGAQDHLGRRPERRLRSRRATASELEAAARAARQGRAQPGRRRQRPWPSAKTQVEAEYYVPAPRPGADGAAGRASCGSRTGSARPGPAPRRRRRPTTGSPKRLELPADKVTVNVTLLGGGFGRKSKPDLRARGGALQPGDGRRAGQADLDPRGRPPPRLTTTPSRSSGWRPGSMPSGMPVAWLHRIGGADDRLDLRARPEARSCRSSSAWGWSTRRSPSPTSGSRTRQRQAHVRIGWFRSVSNIPHAFAHPVLRRPNWRMPPDATRRTTCSS